MNKPTWKFFRSRYMRKFHPYKFRILLGVFVLLLITYQIIPRVLFKTPWTYVGWYDSEFRLNVDENEITILRWTSLWGEKYDAEVLTAEDCPYLQPSSSARTNDLFNIPCRISYDRRYLRASDALVFHSFDLMR